MTAPACVVGHAGKLNLPVTVLMTNGTLAIVTSVVARGSKAESMNDEQIQAAADEIWQRVDSEKYLTLPNKYEIETIIKSHCTPAGDLVSREGVLKAVEMLSPDYRETKTVESIAAAIRALAPVEQEEK